MNGWLQLACRSGYSLMLLWSLVRLQPITCDAATPAEEKEQCKRQLKLLAEALGNYRQDHESAFPAKLGDLYPEYISDLSLLRCPVAEAKGKGGPEDSSLVAPGEKDGRVVGYTWEMSQEDPSDWAGGMSFPDFKKLQRKSLVGKFVPIIRCSHHGEDLQLNLTEDGSIYESGQYWECNFVDRIPWIRLSPPFLEHANLPMSALVQPRPDDATDAMLDLRPWYNARFEDPWVMGNRAIEQVQPDRELGRGLITSQGITFDAAGIIQLNGRINKIGGWDGFDGLIYPTNLKSIGIKRPFKVMHVLGAVQFQDPPGTNVATIEIYRTNTPPEKWVWRYGVDVLNYRFVPGASEPQLKSTTVAWTGSFLHPEAQKEKPRLFHLRYATAKPEAVVDHLDFLAGEGYSSPFIVAITLE